MNLLKMTCLLLLLNILLVQSFNMKRENYLSSDCSGSPSNTITDDTADHKEFECVENGKTIKHKLLNMEWEYGKCMKVPISAIQNMPSGIVLPKSYKVTWSGWCEDSLPGWAIALIVLAVLLFLAALGVGSYFMFCRKQQTSKSPYGNNV